MSRAQIVINGNADRALVARWAEQAQPGTRIEFKSAKRTIDQNSRFWAMLTDIAVQLPWHGQKLRADDWRLIFLDALKQELRIVPNVDGTGFVNLGRSSSDLSKQEFSELLELIAEFGARHGVKFHDHAELEPA